MKNILVINSQSEKTKPWLDLLGVFNEQSYRFYFFTDSEKTIDNKSEKVYLGPAAISKSNAFLISILWPLLVSRAFVKLLVRKKRLNLTSVILIGWYEKLIFSLPAHWLKLNCLWVELPENIYDKRMPLVRKIYKRLAGRAQLIVFWEETKDRLKKIGVTEKISKIPLAIKRSQPIHQANIFSRLVDKDRVNYDKKYFTIGAITDLSETRQLENLFQAIKSAIDVIPNIQLVIIGEGEEQKRLGWLARKLGIDSFVWFVGRQDHLKKWLDSFDIYVEAKEKIELESLEIFLKIMSEEVPIIANKDKGFEDFIADKETGILVEENNIEDLAQAIIKLQQNKNLREDLARRAKIKIEENYNLSRVSEVILKLL